MNSKTAKYMGFNHRKVTPLWPQANGEVERFMKPLGKAVKTAHIEHKNWKQKLYTFLRNYRATPHCTTKVSPAELLYGRPMRTKLPEWHVEQDDQKIRNQDRKAKQKMKMYADRGNKNPSIPELGSTVLVRQQRKPGKLDPPYEPVPYEVISRKGTMVTAQHGQRKITRNMSFFKPVDKTLKNIGLDEEEEDEEEEEEVVIQQSAGADIPQNGPHAEPPKRYSLCQNCKLPKYLQDYVR